MMFYSLFSVSPSLLLLTLFSFFLFFTIRQLLIKKKIFILIFYLCFSCILFIASVGGGGVQNDGYERLETFVSLEKNQQLEQAKKNPKNVDSMLQIDLEQFQNSDEFRTYLKEYDVTVDRAEAITIGFIFVLLAEMSLALVKLLHFSVAKIKRNEKQVS